MTQKNMTEFSAGYLDIRIKGRLSVSESIILLVEEEFRELTEIQPEDWPFLAPIPSKAQRKDDAIGALLRGVAAGREAADTIAMLAPERFRDFLSEEFAQLLQWLICDKLRLDHSEALAAADMMQRAAWDGYTERLEEMRASFVPSQMGTA